MQREEEDLGNFGPALNHFTQTRADVAIDSKKGPWLLFEGGEIFKGGYSEELNDDIFTNSSDVLDNQS